jgi:hypothetical protein
MTAPSDFEVTPLSGDLSWLEAYAEARKTMTCTTHTAPDDAPASSRPLRWPLMVEVYASMATVEEPEPR